MSDIVFRVTNTPPLVVVDDEDTTKPQFSIRPCHIDVYQNKNFDKAFTDKDTAASSEIIVRFCRMKGGWYPFTLAEMNDYMQGLSQYRGASFDFNGLLDYLYIEALSDETRIDTGRVVYGSDKRFRVTAEFILLCYWAAYVAQVPQPA